MSDKRRLPKFLAFLQQAFWLRPTGHMPRWGEDCERRAVNWLRILDHPSQSLGFRVKLERLRGEDDLFDEDMALKANCRELQVRVLALQDEFDAISEICNRSFRMAPMAKLFGALLHQALDDGASAVRINFLAETYVPGSESASEGQAFMDRLLKKEQGILKGCRVRLLVGQAWQVAMVIPQNLATPLRGKALTLEESIKQGFCPMFEKDGAPIELEFLWEPDAVVIALNGFKVESLMSIQST